MPNISQANNSWQLYAIGQKNAVTLIYFLKSETTASDGIVTGYDNHIVRRLLNLMFVVVTRPGVTQLTIDTFIHACPSLPVLIPVRLGHEITDR
jgi:hypothetical protein